MSTRELYSDQDESDNGDNLEEMEDKHGDTF